MKWKKFTEIICKSKISCDVQYKILLDLFEEAGNQNSPSESAVKSWLNEKRNCKASTYFPSGKVDTKNLFRYFRKRPEGKLKSLQKMFCDEITLDADSPIDVKTNDMDIFCQSLVNQFLDLLGFQRVDIPNTDMPSEVAVVEASQPLDNHEACVPIDAISDQEEDAVQEADGAPSISRADISKARERSIRSMILLHSDDCCYQCDYWQGDRKTFGAYTKALPGVCKWNVGQRKLSSDLPCEDYKKRQNQPGDW